MIDVYSELGFDNPSGNVIEKAYMQDIDDFIHEFIVAERELRRRSAELEQELWARFAIPNLYPRGLDPVEIQKKYDDFTKLETFNETGDKATVITTTVRPSQWVTRARYTLCQMNGVWRIRCLEFECQVCFGTGKYKVSTAKSEFVERDCITCDGKGWFVPYAPQGIGQAPLSSVRRSTPQSTR